MIKQKKGFTLIELLVVIAIIGILSAIGLVSLNGAREKARDSKAKSDLSTFRTGLTLYYDDYSSTWPGEAVNATADVSANSAGAGATGIFASGGRVVTEYVATLTSPSTTNRYLFISNSSAAHVPGSTTVGISTEWVLSYLLESSGSNNFYYTDYWNDTTKTDVFTDIKDANTGAPTCADGSACTP